MVERNPTVDRILGCAIAVHRALGPGLMESAYQHCLSYEFTLNRVAFRAQVPIPVAYRGTFVSCGYRADFVVDDEVLVELKSVECLMPLHDAQVLTYLRLTGLPRALLLNFNVPVLKTGIKSFLNSKRPRLVPSAPDRPTPTGSSAEQDCE
jgi:GxxExxY protein